MCIKKLYNVIVSEYAKKHFIKIFIRKYKSWDKTFEFINMMLSDIEFYLTSTKVEKIHIWDSWYIAKCEFKIVWSNESAKTSWNRIIVFVDEERLESYILLIYCKTDIWWHNETAWWEKEIKDNHKEIACLFSWL